MENRERKIPMPAVNQAFRDAASRHLAECGLPENLIDGVDCSSYEDMERTLSEVKECFYSSVRKHIEETCGAGREKDPVSQWKQPAEYKGHNWEMFRRMDCSPDSNRCIADLHTIISMEAPLGQLNSELERLEKLNEGLLFKMRETSKKEEDSERLTDYIETENAIRWQLEKEAFICGFRTAYHLFHECHIQ